MKSNRILAALAAATTLMAGCAGTPSALAPPGSATVPPASVEPANTSAAAGGLTVDGFMDKVIAAQQGAKTYTIDMSMQTALMGKPTKMVMKGAVDQSDRSNIKMAMDIDMGAAGVMKTLKVDGDMYLQLGAGGKKWMKVPKAEMSKYEGTTDSADITAGMEKARTAMKKVEQLGDETLDGTLTHHYRITVDADGLSKMTGSEARIAGDTFDYDVWLDDAGLLRKVAMDVKADADGKELPMAVEGVMGHYNEPVSITAPDAGDVVEMGG